MKNIRVSVFVAALGLVCPLTGRGEMAGRPSFSADLVMTGADGQRRNERGRIHVANADVRIETPDLRGGFFVVDGDMHTALFVRPRLHIFMDAKASSRLTTVFVPVDPSDVCRQWQIMEAVAYGPDEAREQQCEMLGAERLDRRETVKYRVTSRDHRRTTRWIDPQRGFPVKLEHEDGGGSVTLEHIVEAPQPATLFAIPPDYRRFDPLQLIEQLKQSDVWVPPPQ